jgi:hypothetical protein
MGTNPKRQNSPAPLPQKMSKMKKFQGFIFQSRDEFVLFTDMKKTRTHSGFREDKVWIRKLVRVLTKDSHDLEAAGDGLEGVGPVLAGQAARQIRLVRESACCAKIL